ncbi:uncharacterized protein [Lepisosteus oculatus]|uniref:uncharacterized protein n=1 Tax=Lepisosteus oculatus TaxID=7918 RepID=UPI0035F5275E
MSSQSNTKLQLCVLLLSLQAHCRTGRSVSPGQNVSLECPLSTGEVYWYRQDSAELLLAILRSFESTSTTPFYYNGFGKHYSLETNSRLLIHNVTSHDSGMYYCARKEKDIFVFSNGTRLDVTRENISNSHSGGNIINSSAGNTESCRLSSWVWAVLGVLSVLLICSVAAAVRGRGGRSQLQQHSETRVRKESREAVGAEGHYQELSHRDTAVYEVCGTQHQHRTQ